MIEMMNDHSDDEVILNCEYTFDENSKPGPLILPQKKTKCRWISIHSDSSDSNKDTCGWYEKRKRRRFSGSSSSYDDEKSENLSHQSDTEIALDDDDDSKKDAIESDDCEIISVIQIAVVLLQTPVTLIPMIMKVF